MGSKKLPEFQRHLPLKKFIGKNDIKYLQGLMDGAELKDLNKALGNNTPDIKTHLHEVGYLKLLGEKGELGEPQFPIIYVVYSPFHQAEVFRGDEACMMLDHLFQTRLNLPVPIPPQKRLKVTKDIIYMINGQEPVLQFWRRKLHIYDWRLKPSAFGALKLQEEKIKITRLPAEPPEKKKRGRKQKKKVDESSVESPDAHTKEVIDSLEAWNISPTKKWNLKEDPDFNRGWEQENPLIALPEAGGKIYVIGAVPIRDPEKAKMYSRKISPRSVSKPKKKKVNQKKRRKQADEDLEPFKDLDDPNAINPFDDENEDEEDEVAVSRFF